MFQWGPLRVFKGARKGAPDSRAPSVFKGALLTGGFLGVTLRTIIGGGWSLLCCLLYVL